MFSDIEISWLGKYFTLHRVIHFYVQNLADSFMGTIASRNVNHSWVVPTASVLKAIRNVRRSWAEMGFVHNWNEAHQWSLCQAHIPQGAEMQSHQHHPSQVPQSSLHPHRRAVSTKELVGTLGWTNLLCHLQSLLPPLPHYFTAQPVGKTWPQLEGLVKDFSR